jgi:hypothetical protein
LFLFLFLLGNHHTREEKLAFNRGRSERADKNRLPSMALAPAPLQCFLTSSRPAVCTATPPNKRARRPSRISCRASGDDKDKVPSSGGNDLGVKQLGKLAMVALAAGVLALGPVDGAVAAKSGGRVGGQAFRSAPRSSGPRINNSR